LNEISRPATPSGWRIDIERLARLGRDDLGQLVPLLAERQRDLAADVAARDDRARRPLRLRAPGGLDRRGHVLRAGARKATQPRPVSRRELVEPLTRPRRHVLPVDVVRDLIRDHQADQPPSTTRLAPVM
jgi:hypothetical protein